MLATVALQFCCLLAQHELIISANKPYHALGLLTFLTILYTLKKNTQWSTALSCIATTICLLGTLIVLPASTINIITSSIPN